MGLLHVLGLEPPGSPAPGAGGRRFTPIRVTLSQRGTIRETLVSSTLATTAVQGDVSSRLTHKADAEKAIAARAQTYTGLNDDNYKRLRDAAQRTVTALDGHAAKASVAVSIRDAQDKIAAADAAIAAGKPADARLRAAEANSIAASARQLAEAVVNFGKSRETVLAELFALDGVEEAADITKFVGFVSDALKLAKGPPPKVPEALAKLDTVKEGLAYMIGKVVDDEDKRLQAIEAMSADAQAAVAGDLAEGKRLMAAARAAQGKGEWSACLIAATAARDFLAPSVRMAGRRNGFDTQRAATTGLLDKIKADPAIRAQAGDLDARVAKADQLADPAVQKFEEGQRALEAIAVRCQAWLDASAGITEANTRVAAVDKAIAELSAGPSAKATQALRDSAQAQRDEAQKMLTLASSGNDLARGVEGALAAARHAAQDIGQAQALADALKASQAAAGAARPGDLAGMKAALKTLRADLAAARAAKPPAAAEAEFVKADAAAAATDAAITKKDGNAAAAALKNAAQSLGDGQTIAVAQSQFDALAVALDQRRTKLGALKNALSIQPQLAALDQAIALARAAGGEKAITALRKAEEAATIAEHAAAERDAFEREANAVNALLGAVTDAKLIADVKKQVDAARTKAQALKFGEALRTLQAARVQADRGRMTSLAAKKPPRPADIADIAAVAADLAKHGAGGDVDALLQMLPAGTDPKVAAALLQGRFTVEVQINTTVGAAAHELNSLKAIGKQLKTVPKDAADNPSLRKITHKDAPDDPGGMYDQRDASMNMVGRVNAKYKQQFGSKLQAPDGKPVAPGAKPVLIDQLPSDVDPKCKPVNEDEVDVLDWSSLHEVGHGIDDKHKYMLRHQHQSDHGGWVSYGSDVKKVADVVGPHHGFYTTPEQQKYVLDKLMSVPPVDPPPDPKTKAKKDAFDRWHEIATSADVWRREADCKAITIGTLIFHEAYPRQWVSYEAAARKKGLTGYQFKHPGEWFSELYAGYKSGKLGKQHPARAFLEQLSP